jgi:hypothetical protein
LRPIEFLLGYCACFRIHLYLQLSGRSVVVHCAPTDTMQAGQHIFAGAVC